MAIPGRTAPLTAEELQALREISAGVIHIPWRYRDRLVKLGYVEDTFSGPRITDTGKLRLSVGM
jgi:hypothetical protein